MQKSTGKREKRDQWIQVREFERDAEGLWIDCDCQGMQRKSVVCTHFVAASCFTIRLRTS